MWNLDLLDSITIGAAATVPIIVALTQMVKMTGFVQDKYAPFVSIGMGILVSFLLTSAEARDWGQIVLSGILFGLAASGLYSGVKTSAHAIKTDRRAENKRNEEKDKHK
jgi:hypothetical protein